MSPTKPPLVGASTPLPLPPPFSHSALRLLTQGAEALVFHTTLLDSRTPVALKYRPPKPYRHPLLDRRLTRQRLLAEARVLVKCRKEGVLVPDVVALGADEGWLGLGWVEGATVRRVLDKWVGKRGEEGEGELMGLMGRVGRAVGRMHEIGVCHGDLTTSNLMDSPADLRSLAGDIVLIDFGLATQSIQDEDRAVDLYVLERAFAATHPVAEPLFQEVLRTYGESYKGAKVVLRRLEDVRMRGRKRSMLG
ncbi:kinase-like protein [Mytilinidion resinicola]|uniref:EKC/KEOPS complex subunit BUD32 n=1 Tax=Mytilinidion resinicola TaxID=574789 RepID=A0A6A6Z8Y7_9PEZI|nr:kinase-like protein [Mytilinidion resinicola]KAF2817582.1 kinase-like protein [Mytilinidion resinicola]